MNSLPPIGKPAGHYSGKGLNLSRAPVWPTPDPIIEPRIAVTDVPWQPTRVLPTWANRQPGPEMGSRLAVDEFGGKITICVLCYGDHYEMHRRCLNSILQTVPANRLELRVAANCVGVDTITYLRGLPIFKLYEYEENAFKYPIMRDMFWDEDDPIRTNYIAWFDDDAFVQHNDWLNRLVDTALKQPSSVGMYGIPMYYRLTAYGFDPRIWFKESGWFRNRQFRNERGMPAANGDTIHFCVGWFWVLKTDIMRACDIPCPRLLQAGGDIVVGEQLYQNGYHHKQFNLGKSLIYTPPRDRKLRWTLASPTYPWEQYREQ